MSDVPQFLLHVGYPKSGTTTLQAGIFADRPDIFFAGKTQGPSGEEITPEADRFRTLVSYASAAHLKRHGAGAIAGLDRIWQASGKRKLLMSLEGMTNPMVDTHYTQPRDIFTKATHIAELLAPVRARGVELRFLVTLRAQTDLLPSLFSQIYLHGFTTGLYPPSYDGFLDFMLGDEIMGFGPDFFFDAYLDHLGALFGAENVFAADMKALLKGEGGTQALADFLETDTATCAEQVAASPRMNTRKLAGGRRMMVKSGALQQFEANTGFAVRRRAFGMMDRLNLRRGKPVLWQLPDRTERIAAYYAASNARLAETYGITI
ncbi:MAG: hypothetical protein AAFY14_05275 [Pseudomonadota bacterium]